MEGLRIGTAARRAACRRRSPRRAPVRRLVPEPAPSELAKARQRAVTEREWRAFARAYRREMATPEIRRTLDPAAALARADFSVGCYRVSERAATALLRELRPYGADLAQELR
jgi:hypothetical protein